MNRVTRTERGWTAHFGAAHHCNFRRNTLLECGDIRIVVSSVGAMQMSEGKEFEEIGLDRYYETMVFHAHWDDPYWDADISRQISCFSSPWHIDHINHGSDKEANEMHEKIAQELTEMMEQDPQSVLKEQGDVDDIQT